jgi:hypothetical protein
VGGFVPAQSGTDNQIPVLTSGALVLGHATAAGIKATGSNVLTLQSGVTGDIQFFSSSNKITSAGALTIAGLFTANGGISLGTQALTGTTGIIDYTNFDVDATGNIAVAAAKGLDTNGAGTLQLGKSNATAIDLCNSANCDTISIGNLSSTDADAITIGDALDTTVINSTGWNVTGAGALTMVSGSFSGAISANGGITFDQSTDTIGAHTLGGTLDASTQIITNIGNSGTDFIASTGALNLAGILTANGGISLTTQSLTGTTGNIDYTNFDVIGSSGNTDIGGTITAGSGNEILTLSTGKIDADALTLFAGADGVGITSSASGLERQSDGLTLLQGCANNQILKWVEATDTWDCSADSSGGLSDADYGDIVVGGSGTTMQVDADVIDWADIADATTLDAGTSISFGASNYALTFTNNGSANEIHDLTSTGDFIIQDNSTTFATFDDAGVITFAPGALTSGSDFILNEAAGTNFQVTALAAPTVDMVALTNAGLGTVSSGADGLSVNFVTGDGANLTNSAIDITLTNGGTAAGDVIRGLTLNNVTPTAATETGIYLGTGYDNDIEFADATVTFKVTDGGNLSIVDGTSGVGSLLTVGSITSRGDLDVYGNITNKGYKKSLGVAGIIDIFVYDTTKDPDGGAWRTDPNSSYKSWYTETKDDGAGDPCVPASDDRCGSSAFPAKAIIVSTADSVYIFDANTNGLWMKFAQNASAYALGVDTNNNPSGVFALMGTVYAGANGSAPGGLYAFDFVNDKLYNYNTTDRDTGDKNIANRNTAVTYSTDSITQLAIADNAVNDVHGAVLTQSGAVAANYNTTVGMTFIVAATDSSASVINLGSTKTLDYGDNATDDVNQVWLTTRGRLYLTNETLSQVELYTAIDQDVADQITPDDLYDEQAANPPFLAKTAPTMSTSPGALTVLERESAADQNNALALSVTNTMNGGDIIYVGHSLGLSELHTVGIPSTSNLGWAKYYSTTGETSLMNGTSRAMFTMNDASGDITDASIRANVLEAKGTPTYQVNGVHDYGMSFNGTSQYACSDTNNDATCDQDTDFDPGLLGFTVSLWFKHATSISGTDTLVDHTYTTAPALANGFRIWMNSSGQIQAGIDDDTATNVFDDDIIAGAGPSLADGQWHHVVFERVSTAFASPNAPMAAGIYLFVDGKMIGSDTTIAATLTLTTANVVLGVGADCSVGAACATGANFWDGQIDDVYIAMAGVTTSDSPNAGAGAIARMYSEGKAAMLRPASLMVDATTVSSNTIGDSTAAYKINELVGEIVEISGGTDTDCAGITRKITSNTATVLTFDTAVPANCTLDTTSDYEVNPEQLYGASNTVTSVSVTDTDPLNKSHTMYVGTNSGSDTGGVSVYANQYGTPALTDVYHAGATYTDDSGTSWTGSGFDDIKAVQARSGIVVFGSTGGLWSRKEDRSLEQGMDYLVNSLSDIRQELLTDALQGSAVNGGGADLAEYYYSNEKLEPGDVVAIQPDQPAGVGKSSVRYQKNLLGIVSTYPALTLGPVAENAYPIALAGRIPVKITDENGAIHAGDMLTSASKPGYAMKATGAGAVLGRVINEPEGMVSCKVPLPAIEDLVGDGPGVEAIDMLTADATSSPTEHGDKGIASSQTDEVIDPNTPQCGYAMLFVGLSDSLGENIDKLAQRFAEEHPSTKDVTVSGLEVSAVDVDKNILQKKIMAFLEATKLGYKEDEELQSIFTDKIAAALEILAPEVYTKGLLVDAISSFNNEVVNMMSDVEFFGTPYLNKDTAGFAVIKKGAKEVHVTFGKQYIEQPIVNVTITFEEGGGEEDVFKNDIRYLVTRKGVSGFTVLLNKGASSDTKFSWTAFAVKNPTVSFSLIADQAVNLESTSVSTSTGDGHDPVPDLPEPAVEAVPVPEVVPDDLVPAEPEPILNPEPAPVVEPAVVETPPSEPEQQVETSEF